MHFIRYNVLIVCTVGKEVMIKTQDRSALESFKTVLLVVIKLNRLIIKAPRQILLFYLSCDVTDVAPLEGYCS